MSQVAMPSRKLTPESLDDWARYLEQSAEKASSVELRDARVLAAKSLENEAVRAAIARQATP